MVGRRGRLGAEVRSRHTALERRAGSRDRSPGACRIGTGPIQGGGAAWRPPAKESPGSAADRHDRHHGSGIRRGARGRTSLGGCGAPSRGRPPDGRSEEHTSELQSQSNLVCRLLLEKKKKKTQDRDTGTQKSKDKRVTD